MEMIENDRVVSDIIQEQQEIGSMIGFVGLEAHDDEDREVDYEVESEEESDYEVESDGLPEDQPESADEDTEADDDDDAPPYIQTFSQARYLGNQLRTRTAADANMFKGVLG
jgi:hypothetical protein